MKGGGSVVGDIPKGLPTLTMPSVNLSLFLKLFPYAIIISLLGFMEAISIAKAMAAKTGQSIDPNQELIGQGIKYYGSFCQQLSCFRFILQVGCKFPGRCRLRECQVLLQAYLSSLLYITCYPLDASFAESRTCWQ